MVTNLPPAVRAGGWVSEDLVYEILLRLPVKSLLRFRSVSKLWRSIISNHDFIKSHSILGVGEAVIARNYNPTDGSKIYSISLQHVNSSHDLKFPYAKHKYPISKYIEFLVGSACGIVCVCVRISDYHISDYHIYLWNPATKQAKLIPPHSITIHDWTTMLGFGFDPITNDFKVVRVVWSCFSCEVYSSNTNLWRKVDQNQISSIVPICDDCVFSCVKGFLFSGILDGMMAFDLKREVLCLGIKLPVRSEFVRPIDFNDSIAVIDWELTNCKYNMKLWKLDDETCLHVGGSAEVSWTMMLNIESHHSIDLQYDEDMGPVMRFVNRYLNGGDFLVLISGVWYLYNPDTEEASFFFDSFDLNQIFEYNESLISLTGFELVNRNGGEGADDAVFIE